MKLTLYEKKIGIRNGSCNLPIRFYLTHPMTVLSIIKRKLKGLFYYGFDTSETWDLDYSLARWLYPRLVHLQKNSNSYPPRIETHEEWLEILKEISDGIEAYLLFEDNGVFEEYNVVMDGYRRSLQLIAEYIGDLWD